MTEAILFPDIEALLVKYLPELVEVGVTTKVPNPRPASFVTVTRVGGTRRDRVTDQPLVVVRGYAATEAAAAVLTAKAQAHVYALEGQTVDGDFVRAVREIGGLQSFPDPLSESPRYQFTAQLDTRGVAL